MTAGRLLDDRAAGTEHGADVAAELLREHQRDAIEQALGFLGDVDLLVAPIDVRRRPDRVACA